MTTIHKLKKHQSDIPYDMVARVVSQGVTNPDSLAIWLYLYSQSENWKVIEDDVRKHFNLGRTRYLAAMKQLRDMGLYKVIRTVDSNGNFTGSKFVIFQIPQQTTDTENHKYGKPQVRKTTLTENDTYIKEKEIIKEKESYKKEQELCDNAPTQLAAATQPPVNKTDSPMPKAKANTSKWLPYANDFEKELIDYRKSIKKPIKTPRGLTSLVNAIHNTAKAWSVHPDVVKNFMMDNEWQSVKPDYSNPFFSPKKQEATQPKPNVRYFDTQEEPKNEPQQDKQAINKQIDELKDLLGEKL